MAQTQHVCMAQGRCVRRMAPLPSPQHPSAAGTDPGGSDPLEKKTLNPGELIPPNSHGSPCPMGGPILKHTAVQALPPHSPLPGRHGWAKSHPCQCSHPADVAAAGPATRR